jgi:peroxiredoxin
MRWAWLFLGACAIGALVVSWPRSAAPTFTGTLPVLATAPAWTLHDVDGREVRSADFKGKVVVVDFWATWCEPCLREIPGYIALQKKYAAQGLTVLGFSVDRVEPTAVKAFGAEHAMNYPLLLTDDTATKAFMGPEVFPIPTTFLIDREGRVRHIKTGVADPSEYEALVVSVLKETAAPTAPASPAPTPR